MTNREGETVNNNCLIKAQRSLKGDYGAQNGSVLFATGRAVSFYLKRLYSTSAQRETALSTEQRNNLIRERNAAGETLVELAHEFGISYQRVHQIVHRRRK